MKYQILIVLACNESCINQACDRTDGSCLYGCGDEHQCVDGISPIWINFRKIFYIIMYIVKVLITLDKLNM